MGGTSSRGYWAFPKQIKYIIGNEACERFSYYGMRSILVVFMISQLAMQHQDAKAVFHLFAGACYLLPLLGAYLSDRWIGKYRTILYLSIVYCLGHLALALWESQEGLYLGLALIAIGSGGIKPCVSAYVGDQFSQKDKSLLERVFDLFYFSINFGSFFSTLLIPFVLVRWGSKVAFGIPGILMAIATLLFWLGRKSYVNLPPAQESGKAGFMPVFLYALKHQRQRRRLALLRGRDPGFLGVARERYSEEEVDAAQAVLAIMKVFATVSVFWALFDQSASSWVLQGQQMDLGFFGVQLEAAQFQAINPILVLLLIPVFGSGIYPMIQRLGIQVTPLRKMSVGMMLAGFSFIVVALLQAAIDNGAKPSIAWQFIPYLILTCSEIMISITGLEFAYTQAPPSMKSTIMSFWLLTVFVGNLLDAVVAKLNIFEGASYFYFFAALMFLVSFLFSVSASRYRERNYFQKARELVPSVG